MAEPSAGPSRSDLVRAALTVILALILLQFVWQTRLLVLLCLLGALLGIAVTPAVDWLERHRVRRVFGAPLIVLGVLTLFVLVIVFSGPTMLQQIDGLRVQIPAALQQFDGYLSREYADLVETLLPPPEDMPDGVVPGFSDRLWAVISSNLGSARGLLFGAVSSTLAAVAGSILVVFLTIYFAIAPTTYRSGILLLVPPERRQRGAQVFDAVVTTLRTWLSTQLIAMVTIGTVTTTGLLLLGVKSALPLGLIAGVLEFIPTIGPLLSAIPAVLIAFADSPSKALAVVAMYWAIQFVENNLLIPYLMQEELDLPPAVTLLWQALMAIVFGFVGLFIAVPLLAALMVSVRMLYVRGTVPAPRRPRGSKALVAIADEDLDRDWL
jgi:predicted PurR-regulated permease PerM